MTEEQINHAAEVATETIKQLPLEIASVAWINVFQAMIQEESPSTRSASAISEE